MNTNKKIAVIGSGGAGLSAAYNLANHFKVTLYEASSRVGGHIHPVAVKEGNNVFNFDTGFMVFNTINYPTLTQFFNNNNIPTEETSMSLAMRNNLGFEFTGSPFYKFLFQTKNLIKPSFIGFFREIIAFNNCARAALYLHSANISNNESSINTAFKLEEFSKKELLKTPKAWMLNCMLGELLNSKLFSSKLFLQYLFPISGAIWSSATENVMKFPLLSLVKFLHNHGMLGVNTQYQWKVLSGRSTAYLETIQKPFKKNIYLNTSVKKIKQLKNGMVQVVSKNSDENYNKVVIATHANSALKILESPTSLEKKFLSTFQYEKSDVFLHSDSSYMPKNKALWSSWNVFTKLPPSAAENNFNKNIGEMSFHYYLNKLQKVKAKKNYFVSLNPPWEVNSKKIHWYGKYSHPLLSVKSEAIKPKLNELNKQKNIFFCGSYFGSGFHEDAFKAGLEAAKAVIRSCAIATKKN